MEANEPLEFEVVRTILFLVTLTACGSASVAGTHEVSTTDAGAGGVLTADESEAGSPDQIATGAAGGQPSVGDGGAKPASVAGAGPIDSSGAGGEVEEGGAGGRGTLDDGGEGGEITQEPQIPLWKHCGDAICNSDELCVAKFGKPVCLKIPGVDGECSPDVTVNNPEFMAKCDSQPIQCSHPYWNCRAVVDNNSDDYCLAMGKDPIVGVGYWNCGPPP